MKNILVLMSALLILFSFNKDQNDNKKQDKKPSQPHSQCIVTNKSNVVCFPIKK